MSDKAAFFSSKIKSHAQLSSTFTHNYRTETPSNADPAKHDQNVEIVKLQYDNLNDAFNAKISNSEYYKTHSFRKNGVMAFEIMCPLNQSEEHKQKYGEIDVMQWAEKSTKWIQNHFNTPGKSDNVVSVILHMDESSPHIHAIIIPEDEHGKINSSAFMGKRAEFFRLQDSYALAMEEFHLERGIRKSEDIRTQMKKFYSELSDIIHGVEPVVPWEGASVQEVADLANDRLQTQQAIFYRKEKEHEREILEIKSNYRLSPDIERENTGLKKEVRKLIEREEELLERVHEAEHSSTYEKSNMVDRLNHAISNHPDKDMTNMVYNGINELLRWEEEQRMRDEEVLAKSKDRKKSKTIERTDDE